MAFDTFDTDAVATAGVTFSNGNLTALGAAGSALASSAIVQAVEGKKSGKWYVEFTCNAVSGNVDGVGVVSATGVGSGFLAGANTSNESGWAYYTNGFIFQHGGVQTSVNATSWTTGDVIGLAIDLDNLRVWWRKNGGSWIGTTGTPNPATNTGGFDLSAMAATSNRIYPAANLSGAAAKFTANFGSTTFGSSAPSGFTGWTNTTAGTYFGTFATTGRGSGVNAPPVANNKAVSKFLSTLTGSVSAIVVPFAGSSVTNIKGVIYDDTGTSGLPGALLGVSSNIVTGGGRGERTLTFSGVNVVSGSSYWVGLVSDAAVTTINNFLEAAPLTNGIQYNIGTYSSPTNPFGASPTSANFRYPLLVFVNTTSTETGTAYMAFAGVSFAGQGGRVETASAALNFTGVSFAASANHQLTVVGALAFPGVSFSAQAAAEHVSAGALAFTGVAFAASVVDERIAGGSLAFAGVSFSGAASSEIAAWVTEAYVGVLSVGSPSAQVSEAYVGTLTTGAAGGVEVSEAFVSTLAYVSPCASQRADLWKITRKDGQVFAFTSLDQPITWLATTFSPCASLQDSASESSSELGSVGSVQLIGILSDESITDADIYAGRFNDAAVEVWSVNWGAGLDPAAPFRTAAGTIGKISFGQVSYTAEVLGPTEQLRQTGLVDIYTPGCRFTFGVQDANGIGCPVDADALALNGANVTGAVGRTTIFFDGLMPIEAAVWREGKVRWTYGANAGIECQYEVVEWDHQTILLWDLAPFPPQVGDSFDLLPGCPKDTPSCQTYNVYVSFGGFPDVPGPDALQQNAANLFGGGN